MNNRPITVRSEELNEEYTVFTHKSGLRIYVFPKDMLSSYALIATRFGSVDNHFRVEGEKDFVTVPDGVAHFLEHKMFENEDGEDTFVKFARTGANANAYTSFDLTAYLFSATEELYPSLDILLRSVFSPYFTDENVNKEQGIIAQEIRMGDDDPMSVLQYGMLEGLYKEHSVRINIAGTVDSIAKITPETLYRCHRAFYNPANMFLCVCGDATLEGVCEVADKVLGDLRPMAVESRLVTEGNTAFQRRVEKRMEVAKPLFCIGVKDGRIPSDPKERLKKRIALQLLSMIGFGQSSDFYQEMFERELLSPSFGQWGELSPSYAFFSLYGETDDPEAVFDAFDLYVAGPLLTVINEESLERCRRVLYASFIKSFDSTEEIANLLINDFALEGTDIFSYGEVLRDVDVSYLRRIANELFRPQAYTLSTVLPVEERNRQ